MDSSSISLIATLFLVFTAAIIGGVVARKFSVPMLLGYIGAGILFGNFFPTFIDPKFLQIISDVGVTLLLFTLGVEFSLHRLGKVLRSIAGAGTVQVFCSFLIFFFLFSLMGLGVMPSLFLAIAASLSSTAVVVKILSEKAELETLPGEVLAGWLVVQDLAVIPIMVLVPAIISIAAAAGGQFSQILAIVTTSLVKSVFFLLLIFLLGRFGIPRLLRNIGRLQSREIFVLSTVAIVFVSAVTSFALGLSAALGAFIAGLLVSETHEHHVVFAQIRPLRDVFAVVFFVALGMTIPLSFLAVHAGELLVFTLLVIAIKWGIVMGLMRFLGYHKKTAFLVAVGLVQMSEFGFIIAREGANLKAISADQYLFVVTLTFVTMFVGSPLLFHAHRLYYWWNKEIGLRLPKLFGTNEPSIESASIPLENHVVICGYGRVGKYVGRALTMANIPFLVVDYNHATALALRRQGTNVIYGDPADTGVLGACGLMRARALILAIPDMHTQEMVIAGAQTINKRIRIISRIHHQEDQPRLKSLGVATMVQPEFAAAVAIVERLLPEFGVSSQDLPGTIARLKIEHGLS